MSSKDVMKCMNEGKKAKALMYGEDMIDLRR
jgi:hypothetical protein